MRHRKRIRTAAWAWGCAMLVALAWTTPAWCEDDGGERELIIRSIQDNSFLIEEAYNQEDGVVQNILSFIHYEGRAWAFAFTQEWPLISQKHQISYTIPVMNAGEGTSETGLGDVMLNYRYQLALNGALAVSPRVSLILPTGVANRGTGSETTGLQFNLPISVELGNRWVTHWNAGCTYLPHARAANGDRADTWGYNLGGSVVFGATKNIQLLTEVVWNSMEEVDGPGKTSWSDSFYISPGARFAFNFPSGLQIVPGIAVPIGIGPSAGDVGVLAYLSVEFPFTKNL